MNLVSLGQPGRGSFSTAEQVMILQQKIPEQGRSPSFHMQLI